MFEKCLLANPKQWCPTIGLFCGKSSSNVVNTPTATCRVPLLKKIAIALMYKHSSKKKHTCLYVSPVVKPLPLLYVEYHLGLYIRV